MVRRHIHGNAAAAQAAGIECTDGTRGQPWHRFRTVVSAAPPTDDAAHLNAIRRKMAGWMELLWWRQSNVRPSTPTSAGRPPKHRNQLKTAEPRCR